MSSNLPNSETRFANLPKVDPATALAHLDSLPDAQDPNQEIAGKLPFGLADLSRGDLDQMPDYHNSYFSAVLSTLTLNQAAEKIGLHPATIFAVRNKQPAFDRLVKVCLRYRQEHITAELEQVGLARALGTDGKPSDQLLMFFLKGNSPAKYRERHQGLVSGGLSVSLNFNYTANGDAQGTQSMVIAGESKQIEASAVVIDAAPVEPVEPVGDVQTKTGAAEW